MKTTVSSLLTLALAGLLLLPASFVEGRSVDGAYSPSVVERIIFGKGSKARKAYRNRIKRGKRDSMRQAIVQKHKRFSW